MKKYNLTEIKVVRKFIFAILFAPFLILGGEVSAGDTQNKIESILISESANLVYVYPVGGVRNPPACHGANGNYYSFSLSRPRAKEYYAGLLAAHLSGRMVTFQGTGACNDQSVSETLLYFSILSL